MKVIAIVWILIAGVAVGAQIKLDEASITNLAKIGEIYSKDPNLRSADLETSLKTLRTPKLTTLIDKLVMLRKSDGTVLSDQVLKRPSNDELYLWYVVREIHYNRTNEAKKPRPNIDVAKETLAKEIDSRWLLDNYYYRIRGGISFHFNDADLSSRDLRIDILGFSNNTEKAIFVFNVMESFGGGRFMVLLAMKNFKRILEFTSRFPKFNGKDYFAYKDFDYADFDWIGYEKVESYNSRHLDTFYVTLIAHHRAEMELGNKGSAEKILKGSILSEPKYFNFSSSPDALRSIFGTSK